MAKKRKKSKGKKNIFKLIIIFFCVGIFLTIGKDIFVRHFFNERLTVIPNVMNLSEKDAVKYLKEAGLKVKVNHSRKEDAPADVVYIQFPKAGQEVKVNRTIQIWVNSGEGVKVPDIIGLELLEARSILQGENIQIERIDYQPSNEKYNTIIGVYPKVGTKLDVNQKITLLVSSQKVADSSTVPNLIGLDLNDAKVLLGQIGLSVGRISYSEDATLPINTIMSTNPAAGSKIAPNQKINLVINKGVKAEKEGPSVEEIINETNKSIQNNEIENIINDTLNQINKKESTPKNNEQKKDSTEKKEKGE